MEKFMNELKEAKNPWIKRIGNYLLSRDDIKENLKKENKSLKECFDYVLVEISKKAVKDNHVGYAAGDDEELYALAVHYYDEDVLKVREKNFTTNADGSADATKLVKTKDGKKEQKPSSKEVNQETIDKAVASAIEKYKAEEKEAEKKKKAEAKAKKEVISFVNKWCLKNKLITCFN